MRAWHHQPRWLAVGSAVALLVAVGASASATDAIADTAPAAGVPITVSADALPTWQINGVVWSQVIVGTTVYVTGEFTKARPPGVPAGGSGEVTANNIFAFDISTGNRVSAFNHSLNAQGRSITASPDGTTIYVGGSFTSVDGAARGHIAAFDTASGTLKSGFTPNASGSVRAVSATNSVVYLGGGFSAVSGQSRKNLAAVGANGALQAWAPKADDGSVWSMVVAPDQSRVIVGGAFTTLNGQYAYGMGSLRASGSATAAGDVLPWAANRTIKDATTTGAITSLRTDGTLIYGTGYAYGSGSSFEGTFAATPGDGSITVLNDCHGDTYDVAPIGPVMYSVGHAHDCRWVRSFPDTSPRVRWQRALAQTTTATTTNVGPDNYGWNFNGVPASAVLQWFPQLDAGTHTGQSQAAWSVVGNGSYVVLGGEFPRVNGTPQQGLVRMAVSTLAPNKRGPTYTTNPPRAVPATTATSASTGSVTVTFGTAWDYDNENLTYEVFRDADRVTPVHSTKINTNFWTLPTRSFTDSGLRSASTHTYQVRIRDFFGNTLWSPTSNTVTVK